ncbi:hypothetical protein [Nonomuraea aridisoli]|nr:hypothetical protein [Nonomuraea aridisoli]
MLLLCLALVNELRVDPGAGRTFTATTHGLREALRRVSREDDGG